MSGTSSSGVWSNMLPEGESSTFMFISLVSTVDLRETGNGGVCHIYCIYIPYHIDPCLSLDLLKNSRRRGKISHDRLCRRQMGRHNVRLYVSSDEASGTYIYMYIYVGVQLYM